jgi:hypothetical protein
MSGIGYTHSLGGGSLLPSRGIAGKLARVWIAADLEPV